MNYDCVCVRSWHPSKWQWLIECLTDQETPLSLCSQKSQGWSHQPLMSHVLYAERQKSVHMCNTLRSHSLGLLGMHSWIIFMTKNQFHFLGIRNTISLQRQNSTSKLIHQLLVAKHGPSMSNRSISSFLSFLFLSSCTVSLTWRRSSDQIAVRGDTIYFTRPALTDVLQLICTVRVEVEGSLCTAWRRRWRTGVATVFISLGNQRLGVRFTLRPTKPRGNKPQVPIEGVGPQKRSGLFRGETNLLSRRGIWQL